MGGLSNINCVQTCNNWNLQHIKSYTEKSMSQKIWPSSIIYFNLVLSLMWLKDRREVAHFWVFCCWKNLSDRRKPLYCDFSAMDRYSLDYVRSQLQGNDFFLFGYCWSKKDLGLTVWVYFACKYAWELGLQHGNNVKSAASSIDESSINELLSILSNQFPIKKFLTTKKCFLSFCD